MKKQLGHLVLSGLGSTTRQRLRVFAFLGLAATTLLGGFIVACGDDDTIITDGGTEAGDAQTADQTSPVDGGTDATDANTPDVISIPNFVSLIETAMCGALTRCCFGSDSLADGGIIDGGPFNGQTYNGGKCLASVKNLGFEFSAVGSDFVDGGTVMVDGTKAAECAAKLKTLTCSLGASELQAVRAACFDSFIGKQATGATCKQSIECPKSNFCHPDGGKCAPIAGDGGSCNYYANVRDAGDVFLDSLKNEEACSTRGGGDTRLRCDSYDPIADDYRPRTEWACRPQVANGAICNSTVWCANGICDPDDFACKTPLDYFSLQCPAVLGN